MNEDWAIFGRYIKKYKCHKKTVDTKFDYYEKGFGDVSYSEWNDRCEQFKCDAAMKKRNS